MNMLAPSTNIVIETVEDPEVVRARWDALQRRALATPFQTHEWCLRLYDTVGRARGARPLIVIVRDRGTEEDIALLPLALERRAGTDIVSFADFGLCDYAMPIFIPEGMFQIGTVRTIWPRILEALPSADLIHFDKMPTEFHGEGNPLAGLPGLTTADLDCWRTHLPENWEDYERGLSKRSRRAIRRRASKLNRLGVAEVEFLRGGAEAGRMLDLLRRARKERFERLGRKDAMDDPAVHMFYRGLATGGDGGMPLMSVLRLNGEVVALVFGMLKDMHFYMLAMTFVQGRPELEKCAPALVLVHRMMADLHAEGLRIYDFTIGAESYKRAFGAHREQLHEYLHPLTGRGRAFVMAKRLRSALRHVRRSKRAVLERIDRWRERGHGRGRNRA